MGSVLAFFSSLFLLRGFCMKSPIDFDDCRSCRVEGFTFWASQASVQGGRLAASGIKVPEATGPQLEAPKGSRKKDPESQHPQHLTEVRVHPA